MKNVLVLTDFSTCSKNATQYAINFLKDTTCCFYIMHVHKSGSFTMDDLMSSATANVYESVLKTEQQQLQKFVDEFKETSQNDKHTFESILDYDTFLQAIYRVIEDKKIELVVAGYNGVSNVKEIIFGSHTLSIIRKIDCNTLIVPSDVKYHQPNTIFLPLDPKDHIQGEAFGEILDIVKTHHIQSHIVRVYEKPTSAPRYDESFLMKHCKDVDYKYHIIQNVPLHYVKSCYMQMHEIDMIGLVVQKESFFERLFKHSSTTEISKSLKKPLFVVHS